MLLCPQLLEFCISGSTRLPRVSGRLVTLSDKSNFTWTKISFHLLPAHTYSLLAITVSASPSSCRSEKNYLYFPPTKNWLAKRTSQTSLVIPAFLFLLPLTPKPTAHIFWEPPTLAALQSGFLNTSSFSQTQIKLLLCAIRIKKTLKYMSRFQILAVPIKWASPEEHELQLGLSRAEHTFSSSHCCIPQLEVQHPCQLINYSLH